MYGNTSLLSSTTFHSQLSSRTAYSASTAVCPQVSTHLTKSSSSIGLWKFHTRDQSAISCGQTQTTDAGGVFPHEVPDTPLAKIYLSSSITQTISNWLHVLTNLWWTAITGPMTEMSSQYSLHRTIVTDVVMRLRSWKWTSSWNTPSCNSIQHPNKMNSETSTEGHQTISCEQSDPVEITYIFVLNHI